MSSVGPELPPHLLVKRKRDSDDEMQSPKKIDSDGTEKRRRVMGPAMPPASLDERPSEPVNDDSEESSDDDYGPALPPAPGSVAEERMHAKQRTAEQHEATARAEEKKPQREEWMLLPPNNDDWSSRIDPTKLKARKFQSGKGSKAPVDTSGGISALWTETPEEKRQRLEDEVLGKKSAAAAVEHGASTVRDRGSEAASTRMKEYNNEEEKKRGRSLYDTHQQASREGTGGKEKEDDPSQRAFDREKDMGLARSIGHVQKRELMNKAADFGSRFAKGSYL